METHSAALPGTDALLTLAVAARLPWLPRRRRGAKPNTATLWRWGHYGVEGIRLKTVRVGGTTCTTERWLREFFEALTAQREVAP